jgi:hypothetical protein
VLFPPGEPGADEAHSQCPVAPIITRAWALTTLLRLPLDLAILGLALGQLVPWLAANMDRVGERSSRTRKHQLLTLLSSEQPPIPP